MPVRRFVVIPVVAALVATATATVTTTTAAAAGPATACAWTARPLPTAADTVGQVLTASGPNAYLVGVGIRAGLTVTQVWHNGALSVLPNPSGWDTHPVAVNGRGVVVGWKYPADLPDGRPERRAVAFVGGAWVTLPGPAGVESVAVGVNENGDIVGRFGSAAPFQVVVWPAGATQQYSIIGSGTPVGIDEARRVVVYEGNIISPSGAVATVAGYPNARVEKFAGGRLVGGFPQADSRREWDISGGLVRETPGFKAIGITPSDMLAAWYRLPFNASAIRIWRSGVADPGGVPNGVEGVTDRDELWGTPWDTSTHPTVWTCV